MIGGPSESIIRRCQNPPGHPRALKVLMICTLGTFIALVIFAFAYDEKLQRYDDLVPAPVIVPGPATNGYLYLQNLWKARPEMRSRDDIWSGKALANKVPWDDARYAQLLRGWENAYAELEAALNMKDRVVAARGDSEELPLKTKGGQRLNLIAEKARRQGKRSEYLEFLLLELRWNRRQMEQASAWEHLLINHSPYWKIIRLLNEGSATKEEITSLQHAWDVEKVFTERLEVCLKHTFAEIREQCIMEGHGPWLRSNERGSLFSRQGRLWFKPNKILNTLHSGSREVIAHALTPSAQKLMRMDYGYSLFHARGQGWSGWLDPNANGKAFRKWMDVAKATLLGSACKSLFYFRSMTIRFAMEQWRFDHDGQLPGKLEELVPNYLNHVPQDPITGGPIEWDAATRVLSAQNPEGGRGQFSWGNLKP